MTAYQDLASVFRRLSALRNASAILEWDNATMLPPHSGDTRAEQMAALAEIQHELITQPHLGEWIANAESGAELDDWQRANLREMKRQWQHATALPAPLVAAMTRATLESEMVWRTARKDNDFASFIPYQENVLNLVREAAQAKSAAMGLSPYDVLLDQYDPGTTSAEIDMLFAGLADFLPGFIERVREYQATQPAVLPTDGHFPVGIQKQLGRQFMKRLGFDFARGRLDESAHPFCGGVPGDVRLTTRYIESDFLTGFFGILHETGHALYEMGLPDKWRDQPVGEARGMGFHESQSLLVQMQLALHPAFLEFAAPLIRKAFNVDGPAWTAENIYRQVTRVQPSLIRVDADEATYPAHIILRYRLERRLIDGTLAVKDLPEAWAKQMQSLLGIVPDSNSYGCMQDIHWPDGSFGYFPTYTLGAMTAAQLFQAAQAALPDLAADIAHGNFQPLTGWLREHVHRFGSRFSSAQLLQQATGKTLDSNVYKKHLETRYLG